MRLKVHFGWLARWLAGPLAGWLPQKLGGGST